MDKSIKNRLAASKVMAAEAAEGPAKIRRDAAYKALVAAQKRGAGPDERLRLTKAYDAAEARVEEAEERARAERRRSMGLEPRVEMGEEELVFFAPDVVARLRALGHGGR